MLSTLTFLTGFNLGRSGTDQIVKQDSVDFREITEPKIKGADIFILIPSGPTYIHFNRRLAIRETWKLDMTQDMNLTFYIGVLGLSKEMKDRLTAESERYKDLVLLDNVKESYSGLTVKMVAIYEHVAKHYHGIKWVFKTDTDSWINVKLLAENLNIPNIKTWLGKASAVNTPVLESEKSEYNNVNYPRFMVGAGYAVSYDVIKWVAEQLRQGWFKAFTNEDEAFGIWVSATPTKILNTDRVNNNWFNKNWSKDQILKDCRVDDFVVHYLPAEYIRWAHRNYKKCKNPCGCL